jgi:hypothetical protein|tara:strand:- start:243 stop:995 length:753 start_codon:yes stop_codon:yes gene_type:complete
MSQATVTYVQKTYKLTRGAAPLSYMLPTRNSKRLPLLHFDEKTGENRALRYARNQKSPFEDEQDGNAIVEPVIFEDGFLTVERNNQVLQKFLHYHPLNTKAFIEVNLEKDAAEEMDKLNLEVDALIEARSLSLDELENVCRVVFGRSTDRMTSSEMRRDVIVFAKSNPTDFLNIFKDPELIFNANVQKFFNDALLTTRKNNSEVWFNTPNNKKKMLTIPFGVETAQAAASFLKSDDGIEALKMLEALIEE